MKTLLLLLIIYSLQYVVRSHGTSTIIYKTFPKKVHPDPDRHTLVNSGSYFKKNYKSKSFTRFEPPPIHVWAGGSPIRSTHQKADLPVPQGSDLLPLDFQGDIKSRVKKVSYFNGQDSRRSKRAVNETKTEITTKETATTTPAQKTETTKPIVVNKQTVAPVAKNVSISRRSGLKNVKPVDKSGTSKRPKQQKVSKVDDAKPVRSRNIKRQGDKKKVKPKSGLRKRKSKSRIARAGKPDVQKVKSEKQVNKKSVGKQASKKLSGRSASKLSGRSASKSSVRQASKSSSRQGNKPAGKQVIKPAGKQVIKKSDKKARKPIAGRRTQTKAHPQERRRVPSRRLISARDARAEDYPYMVSIQKQNEHWCSGAILNPNLVISTANCFWKSRAVSRMKIRAGSHCVDQGGQVAYIAEVRKHPNWSIRKDPANDIALALLDRYLKFSDAIHGVDLPNIFMKPPFDDAWVTSYGSERRDGVFNRVRLTLQVTHMRLMSDDKCNNITSRFGVVLDDSFFCLEQAGRRAPCTRDTGAPAVSDGVLWGLASWGIRKLCGTSRFPAVFSDVSEMTNMDFIVNATKDLMGEQRLSPFLDRLPLRRGEDANIELIQIPNKN